MHAGRTLVVVLAMVGIGSPGSPWHATATAPTHCTFTIDVSFSPGFSMTPASGTFTSTGETGTMDCDGPVDGSRPTGTGTLGNDGRYGTARPSTCLSGTEGDGVDFFTMPTAGGPVRMVSRFTFTGGDPPKRGEGLISGRFDGEHFSGTFEATPTKGDCITSPITVLRAKGEGVLH